jgi:predicted GIY-YIG superfamily endonuclease
VRHTKQLKEFTLVFAEGPFGPIVAVQRERQLKKWSCAKKTALIKGDLPALKELSQSSLVYAESLLDMKD